MVLLLALVVSQTCQKDQVRLTKDQAIAKAEEQVNFEPTRKQVRFLRQGLNSSPFWIVSLSVPFPGEPIDTQRFKKLAVVEINANTGKVTKVSVQR